MKPFPDSVFTPALDGPGTQPITLPSPVPGLEICRDQGARECWSVVHRASGRAVLCDLAGHATAEWAALDLGDLLDWDRSADEVANAADLLCTVEGAIERLAVKHKGVTLGPLAVYASCL